MRNSARWPSLCLGFSHPPGKPIRITLDLSLVTKCLLQLLGLNLSGRHFMSVIWERKVKCDSVYQYPHARGTGRKALASLSARPCFPIPKADASFSGSVHARKNSNSTDSQDVYPGCTAPNFSQIHRYRPHATRS